MGERAIKVLVAKPGLDGHDVGAKVVCRALMAAGMDVTYSGLRQSPEEIAASAKEHGVDVVGLSILSGAHLSLCRRVKEQLDAKGLGELLWVVGGNIPKQDTDALKALGVDGVFPVGTPFDVIVGFVQEQVNP